jgi:uncharacterized protein with ATP-grasp and redox domains
MLPYLPIPLSLRGAEIGSFAHRTMTVRIPEIGRRTLKENSFPAPVVERLQALLAELPEGAVRGLEDREAPDWNAWQQYTAPYQGMDWLQSPWFFAETYFYRRVLEATGYFQPGSGWGVDPYAGQKHQGLRTFAEQIRSACAVVNAGLAGQKQAGMQALITDLISMNLWGNQADLSMWPAGQAERPDHADSARQLSHLLCDHASQAADYLLEQGGKPCRVDVLLDNAGLELVHDLLLADALLSSQIACAVRLHAKAHPTFVSDAILPDIMGTVEFLLQMGTVETSAVVRRLQEHLLMGRLHLRENFFWTSPLGMWEMPAELRQELGEAALVISKGDAHYRRLVGDRHWAFDTPLPGVWNYMPTALLALRVSKSQVMIGLQPGQAQVMDERDPQWMTNGKWGLIQFYRGNNLWYIPEAA